MGSLSNSVVDPEQDPVDPYLIGLLILATIFNDSKKFKKKLFYNIQRFSTYGFLPK
jgi:hypothetical protein